MQGGYNAGSMQWATGGASQPQPQPQPSYAQQYAPAPQQQLVDQLFRKLPPGWEVHESQTTGKQYYANVHTGYTTFDFPTAPADHGDAPGGLVQPELEPQTEPEPEPEPEVEVEPADGSQRRPAPQVATVRSVSVPRGLPSQPPQRIVRYAPMVKPATGGGLEDFSLSAFFSENPWHALLAVVLVFATVMASIGGACLDDTLIGVDECDKTVGAVLLVIGCVVAGLIIVGEVWLYLVKHPEFSEQNRGTLLVSTLILVPALGLGTGGTL